TSTRSTPSSSACTATAAGRVPGTTTPPTRCRVRGRQPPVSRSGALTDGRAAAHGGGGGRPAAAWPPRPGRAARPGGPARPGRSTTACSTLLRASRNQPPGYDSSPRDQLGVYLVAVAVYPNGSGLASA